MNTHTVTVLSENKPGVLYRIADIFLRRKINVESLYVHETEKKGISRFVIVVACDTYILERVILQIKRIVEVIDIEPVTKFHKEPNGLSTTVSEIEVSAIKQIELLARSTPGVISLAQGIPSFATPTHIKKAAKEAIDKGLSDKYTQGYGIQELREAIAKKVRAVNRIKIDASNVIVTHGGMEAIMAVFMTILNPEDELIILTPDYASHITQARIAMHGRAPIFVPLDETAQGWMLNAERLKKAVTPYTKAIVLCNPCNPTGKVYTQEELLEIVRIAKTYNLYVIADEMYEDFVYDGRQHVSIGSLPNAGNRIISVFGVSKSYAMTGWRIGYIVAHPKLIAQIFKIHDSLVTCPTAVSQYASLAAIEGPKDSVTRFREAFEKRRRMVIDELAKTDKLTFATPQGAYYLFAKLKGTVNDVTFAEKIIKEARVAVVPGSAFGKSAEHHIRICFAMDEKKLREGVRRLVAYCNKTL